MLGYIAMIDDEPKMLYNGCCSNPKKGCFLVKQNGASVTLTDPEKPEAGTATMPEMEFRDLVRAMAVHYGMIPPAEGT